ncbi:hypothetical protein H7F16_01170 [Gemmobacter straminiformis]|uniref:SGNH/GDSL hydrolase family protein n=2 Tax=Paragemmobacter straminiformis TaxID=2045119 RepID=A0A842I3T8_9RHOB|nr:hypothetical protein [Gemmobacter straminiformis]
MRILAFGNSHVGAWREAWEGLYAEFPDIEMDFFSLPEKIHARYRLRATGLFAPRRNVTPAERERVAGINGRVECDLSAYDHAVWIGVAWHPERAAELAALGDPYPVGDAGAGRPAYGAGFVTAALAQAAEGVAEAWVAVPALRYRPIVFGRPVYAETCLASGHRLYAPWRGAQAHTAALQVFLDSYRAELVRAAAARGFGFLAPPADLSAPTGLTRPACLAAGGGAVDPAAPDARGDHSHMNALYGRRCIAHLLAEGLGLPL